MRCSLILAIQLLAINISFTDSICETWFKKHYNAKTHKDCISDCTVFLTGMATFHCTSHCAQLCNAKPLERYTFEASKLYSLNDSESALAAEKPKESLRAYTLSWEAERICSNLYPTSQRNDESDACRHYVWATLLTKEFGRELAEKFLYAHENEPTQPIEEKAMDIANNNRGISRAEKRIKDASYSKDKIISDFQEDLNSKKIIVLKRRILHKETTQ